MKKVTDKLLQPTRSDLAHGIAKSALGAIPFAGTAAIEVFNAIIAPPLQRRRDSWLESISSRLKELEQGSSTFRFENLSQNEDFISAIIAATQIALKTHSDEKLKSLRNLVINSAQRKENQEIYQDLFLSLIDQFSPLHIRLLRTFHGNFVWKSLSGKPPATEEVPGFLTACVGSYLEFTEIDRSVLGACIRDLMNKKIIRHMEIKKIRSRNSDGSFVCDAEWRTKEESVSAGKLTIKHGPAIKVDSEVGNLLVVATHLGSLFYKHISGNN